MYSGKPLATAKDLRYIYDGSLVGFYCCVYESVYCRELPLCILTGESAQPSLIRDKYIESDKQRAGRVRASIPIKISPKALRIAETVFLSCLDGKELAILKFLLLGYKQGAKVVSMMGHADVSAVLDAERHVIGEQHLLRGFVRFADYGGMLAATITPKNFVLPFLAGHFAQRYSGEDFIIYDKTHKAALVCKKGSPKIVPIENLELGETTEQEKQYQILWKRFYDTIAIESRINPKLRMTHMPKRYWENMLEVGGDLTPAN